MSALLYVIPFLIFRPAIAAPTGLQGAFATTLPDALRPILQEIVDYLNPRHSPSLKQTLISCFIFLFVSLHVLYPFSRERAKKAKISRLRFSTVATLLALFSPDFAGFMAYKTALIDFFIAVAYNHIFRTEDRNKRWTGVHIAFLRHGGFVLQEDGKPNKVLTFDDLVRMIKAGEVERPDVSRADILAKSIHPSTSRRVLTYLSYFPIYWFAKKFISKIPMMVVFVGLHAVLTWGALLARSRLTIGIKSPIVVVRKPQDESHEEPVLGDDVKKLEDASEFKDFADPADEKVAEELLIGVESKEKVEVESAAPSPDETTHSQLWSNVMWLLALPFKFIGLVLCVLFVFLDDVYATSKISLKHHWAVISGPCHLGTYGSYVAIMLETFVAWIGFVILSWRLPYSVERKIWVVSSLFLFLQPLLLLLVRPQRIRTRINESIKQVIYVLYTFIYVVARISIPFAAIYSIRHAM